MLGVFTFGRFNPPTIGHRRLVAKMAEISDRSYVLASRSADRVRNPLPLDLKLRAIARAFPGVRVQSAPTVFDGLKVLADEGIDEAVFVIGADRTDLAERLCAYSGRPEVCGIRLSMAVVDRQDDAPSATMARSAAVRGDFHAFHRLVPVDEALCRDIYRAVRAGLGGE